MKGFGWQIGNGRFVKLKEHRWGFKGGKSLIHNYIDKGLCAWDMKRVLDLYEVYLGDRICEFLLLRDGAEDRLI